MACTIRWVHTPGAAQRLRCRYKETTSWVTRALKLELCDRNQQKTTRNGTLKPRPGATCFLQHMHTYISTKFYFKIPRTSYCLDSPSCVVLSIEIWYYDHRIMAELCDWKWGKWLFYITIRWASSVIYLDWTAFVWVEKHEATSSDTVPHRISY